MDSTTVSLSIYEEAVMKSGLIIVFNALLAIANSRDPCMYAESIDDVSRNTGYSLSPSETPRCDLIPPKWYRYTNKEGGVMATVCPSGSQCGTRNQVWMNGTVPGLGCEEFVEVCIRQDDNCCDRKTAIRAKNCDSYVVYQLIPLPGCSRYCFGNTNQTFGNDINTPPDCLSTSSKLIPKETTLTTTSKTATKSTPFSSVITPTRPPISGWDSTSVISSTRPSTMKSASTRPSVQTEKGTFSGEALTTSVMSSRKYSSTTMMNSTLSTEFARNNSRLAKGSVGAAVIVGSSIGGAIAGLLVLTGLIAAIIHIRRRKRNKQQRQTYETIAMGRNAVDNPYYSYERNWQKVY